jgi:hypothetical protein
VITRNLILRSIPSIRFALAVSLVSALASTPAHSQYLAKRRIGADLRVAAIAGPAIGGVDAAQNTTAQHLPERALTAGLGWASGALVGAYVWTQIRRHGCSCDDPALKRLTEGGVWGGALGSALGAAAPEWSTPCSFKTRVARSLLGSLSGTAIGLLSPPGGSSVIAVPILSVGGATLAEWRC